MREQRKYQRINAMRGDVKHPEYECLDLSELGMKFKVREAIRVGKVFETELTSVEKPFKVKCRVMWCKQSQSTYDESYHIGIEFVDISTSEQLQVRHLVNDRIGLNKDTAA